MRRLQSVRNQGIVAGAIAVILSLLVAYIISRSIAKPIEALVETTRQIADGDLSQAVPPQQATDEVGKLAAAVHDMTKQIETRIAETEAARDAAQRSDEVKSAFLASMSHELRTPLNAVINFTKFVAKGDLGPVNDQQEETLGEVIDSARHLLNLINDVLDMSKIESGSLRLFVEDDVDVNAILDSATSTGRGLLVDKPVKLRTEIAPDLPNIRADRQRIVQVLLNVMSNACKFTDKGFVKIAAHQANGEVVVAIEDTGPGIAPEDQAGVFESFKQTSSGLRKGGGTGLGMPISKSLVEAHGGRFWLESEVDKGSTFFVALPVRAEHLTPTLVKQGEKV